MKTALTGFVSGKVQGVGFRYYAKTRALELGLTGWVRNLPDGRVEFLAYGDKDQLERFMHYLEVGPFGSRVEKVEFQWFQETRKHPGFEIEG